MVYSMWQSVGFSEDTIRGDSLLNSQLLRRVCDMIRDKKILSGILTKGKYPERMLIHEPNNLDNKIEIFRYI